jgi:Phosphoesterase family
VLPIQAAFNELATQGVRLDQYCALTHPSEPNYVASVGGDFFGMGDDNLYNIPPKCVTTASHDMFCIQFLISISTVVDLLEAKNISWASYQENIPFDGYEGFK